MKEIDVIVRDKLDKHIGGTEFFDALDADIRRSPRIMAELLVRATRERGYGHSYIVSGRFGDQFHKFFDPVFKRLVVVGGELRHNDLLDNLENIVYNKEKFIFLDDSFFKGRTRDKIKAELERCGATLEATYVAYDGSHEKDENVRSLYRYYDYHEK